MTMYADSYNSDVRKPLEAKINLPEDSQVRTPADFVNFFSEFMKVSSPDDPPTQAQWAKIVDMHAEVMASEVRKRFEQDRLMIESNQAKMDMLRAMQAAQLQKTVATPAITIAPSPYNPYLDMSIPANPYSGSIMYQAGTSAGDPVDPGIFAKLTSSIFGKKTI